jgi:hypothetical protein
VICFTAVLANPESAAAAPAAAAVVFNITPTLPARSIEAGKCEETAFTTATATVAAPKVTAIGSISVVASFATATAVSSLTVKVIPEFSLGIVVIFVIEGVDEAESGAGIEVGVKVGVRVEVFPSKRFVPDSSTKNIKPAQYKNI